ncbi:MAG: saccharopine dehydrogenase NADP-binding domain-containing protein [Bacteroidetes bacterium]|nr:saccharopine dehydrogenase NADP-binding domain-containing protein [Bacteroidota bacterium]
MKNILIIGAGRSASSLIRYLLEHSSRETWKITVADVSLELALQKTNRHANARAIAFDVNNQIQREAEVKLADVVVSMLPASMHLLAAKDCLQFGKHLITASYVSKDIAALDADAKKKGVLFLNEMGLDPGIDHMSAMQIIDRIKTSDGELTAFRSYCGGLVAPESNDNPWGYKFTWNPRNVVLAGQGTAQYIEDGQYKYIPYNRLFTQVENISVEGYGEFDAYANRDSLSYRQLYGLESIPTMLRGTLRMKGYCKAWNAFVQLGLTDDTCKIADSNKMTYAQLVEAYLPKGKGSIVHRLSSFLNETEGSELIKKIEWLGILENEKIKISNSSPAEILQELLERKWKLKENDKDMIVMQHKFNYKLNGKEKKITSSLVVKGHDQVYTAMAQTVGLPMAIAVKLLLNGELKGRGVLIPTAREIYEPVLKELEELGIKFIEKQG